MEWTAIGSYGARYEVELPLQQLEAEGIPTLVKGDEPGIWGPGFAGPTSRGITLLVPEDQAERARKLLEPLERSADEASQDGGDEASEG